nr:hypothetical protein [Mycoplasmopsis bovis]
MMLKKCLVSNVSGLGVKGIQKIKKELNLSSIKELFKDVTVVQNVLKTAVYENLKAFIESFDQKDYDFFYEHGLLKLYDKLHTKFENKDFVSRYKNGGDPYELYVDHWIDFKLVDTFASIINPELDSLQKSKSVYLQNIKNQF